MPIRSLVISPFPISRQPRQRTMARHLADYGPVTVASNGPQVSEQEWIEIPSGPRIRTTVERARIIVEAATGLPATRTTTCARTSSIRDVDLDRFDLVSVHDLEVLAAVDSVSPRAAVVFDAREYYPDERGDSFVFRALHSRRLRRHCSELFDRCDAITTVSPGLAELYGELTVRRPIVLTSAKQYVAAEAPEPRTPDSVRLVYHGGVNPDRGIDALIEASKLLDARFSLDVVAVGPSPALARLRELASKTNGRCTVLPPVEMDDIIAMGSTYDIGVLPFAPLHRNLKHCLPNKLFEYVQSRLAVVCGPIDDAAQLASHYGFGVRAASLEPADLALTINALSRERIDAMRRSAHAAAVKLSSERNHDVVRDVVSEALANARRRSESPPNGIRGTSRDLGAVPCAAS